MIDSVLSEAGRAGGEELTLKLLALTFLSKPCQRDARVRIKIRLSSQTNFSFVKDFIINSEVL